MKIESSSPAGLSAPKRARDPRLDFFRGLAMFIILIAHTPGNTWALWIPARFGFSDATEIFVFCSGMASAIAFGSIFVTRGFWLGTARIAFRCWQVYWAHLGMVFFSAAMLFSFDHYDLNFRGWAYTSDPWLVPLFKETGRALIALFTLTWTPGLFDILPMYLAILAMVPVVVLCHRHGGMAGVAALCGLTWLAAQFAGFAWVMRDAEDLTALQAWAVGVGQVVSFMNFEGNPFGENTWFFNPFGWQLVFFTGFALGAKWITPPPVDRRLVWLAAAYVLAVVPFAWYQIHEGLYLPKGWALQVWIAETRAWAEPFWWKTWIGGARYLHFLALAYLAWAAVGPLGRRLSEGFPTPGVPPRALLWTAAAVAVVSIPWTYIEEIEYWLPAVDAWIMENLWLAPYERIGLIHIAHLVALVLLLWAAIGPERRHKVTHDWFTATVPVIRKVGTQSLAVFLVSIPLSRFIGWVMDWLDEPWMWGERDVWVRGIMNLFGFGVLIATAYVVSWFKRQPWRAPVKVPEAGTSGAAVPAGRFVADKR